MTTILILFGDSRHFSDNTAEALIHAATQLNHNTSMVLIGHLSGYTETLTQTRIANKLMSAGIKLIAHQDSLTPPEMLNQVHEICTGLIPEFVIAANTQTGASLIPGLAVKNNGDCITQVKKIIREDSKTGFIKPLLNGRYDIKYNTEARSVYLTIQPEFFKPAHGFFHTSTTDKTPPLSVVNATDRDAFTKALSDPGMLILTSEHPQNKAVVLKDIQTATPGTATALSEAKTIVCAGRGIGNKENIQQIKDFANRFTQSAIAGSRPVIDDGWLEYAHQVGITGKKVSPEIYIAMGLSGSSQHLAGIRHSGLIIAVNHDPEAAIFKASDVCIVADIFEFMAAFQALATCDCQQT